MRGYPSWGGYCAAHRTGSARRWSSRRTWLLTRLLKRLGAPAGTAPLTGRAARAGGAARRGRRAQDAAGAPQGQHARVPAAPPAHPGRLPAHRPAGADRRHHGCAALAGLPAGSRCCSHRCCTRSCPGQGGCHMATLAMPLSVAPWKLLFSGLCCLHCTYSGLCRCFAASCAVHPVCPSMKKAHKRLPATSKQS